VKNILILVDFTNYVLFSKKNLRTFIHLLYFVQGIPNINYINRSSYLTSINSNIIKNTRKLNHDYIVWTNLIGKKPHTSVGDRTGSFVIQVYVLCTFFENKHAKLHSS